MHAIASRPIFTRTLHQSCLVGTTVLVVLTGCQQGRFVSPLASRRAIDNSPPSMHGPSMAGPTTVAQNQSQPAAPLLGQAANRQVRVTSENAVPETNVDPVEQRLATTRQVSHRTPTPQSNDVQANEPTQSTSNSEPKPAQQTQIQSGNLGIAQVSANVPVADSSLHSLAMELPEGYGGVDVSELMSALQDAPPEIQHAAVARLIAMARLRAKPTTQPLSIEEAVEAAFDDLPELPTEVVDQGVSPTRIANSQPIAKRDVTEQTAEPAAVKVAAAPASASRKSAAPATVHTAIHETISDQPISPTPINAPSTNPPSTNVQTAILNETTSDTEATSVSLAMINSPVDSAAVKAEVASLSNAELFDALLKRLQTNEPNESEAERHRRQVMSRHLMVLAGDPDGAVDNLEGMSSEAEEYLRHQLLGLWTIIDPQGHPVPSRRFSSALPEIRKATGHLAAASDLLEVRGLEFCTEIEAYGQIKPFASRRFAAGQEVILYCEIENFVTATVKDGFETKLQGSYDLIDHEGRRVSSQTLPEDHQVSKKLLRDYFIAYQMYLPDAIDPGRYQLRLTMEDVHGKKYGQATVDFEIKR